MTDVSSIAIKATGSSKPQHLSNNEPIRVILLGAPGVGKGTQADLLAKRFGACHLSTGDMFRAATALPASERTPAINAALEYMQRGELVPDSTVLDLVGERIACLKQESGFLLDGFPRTVAQAEAFEKMLARERITLDAVLSYELPLEQVVSRISGRRICPNCKAVFHVETLPPKVADICDKCGARLYQREDDRPESVRVRMATYQKSTAPLADFFSKRNMLVTVRADGTPQEILERSLKALKAHSSLVNA